MTPDRVQPICKIHNMNIGCFDGKRKNPRKITERIYHCSHIKNISV